MATDAIIEELWIVRQAWRTGARAPVIGLWWPGGDLEVRARDVIEP